MNNNDKVAKGVARFKNDQGVWYTRGLFFETSLSKDTVLYTLKEEDHQGYPSLYRLFMEANDPEEYTFATEHLGGWSHWKKLRDSDWFKPYYEAWKEELDIKQRSIALAKIMAASTGSGRDAIEASKYIAEKKWEKKPAGARGRPSNDKIKKEAQRIFTESQQAEKDFERILN